MAFTIAEAFVQIGADHRPMLKGLEAAKKSLEGMKPHFEKLAGFARKMFYAIAGAAAFSLKSAAEASDAQEELRSALQSSMEMANEDAKALGEVGKSQQQIGKDAEAAAEDLGKFAQALQLITVYDDEAIRGGMRLALNLGATADQMKTVTEVGIGLATKFFGGDLQSGMEAAAKAVNGNFRALERMVPGLKNATSAEEKLAIVQRYGLAGFKQAQDRVNTFGGSLKQLWHQISEVGEALGAKMLPYVQQAARFMEALAIRLAALTPEQTQQIVKWGLITAAVAGFVGFAPQMLSVLTMVGGLLKGLGSVLIRVAGLLLANPWVAAAAAIIALGVGFAYAVGEGDTFFARVWDGFKKIGSAIAYAFSSWQNFKNSLVMIKDAIKNSLGSVWGDVKQTVYEIVNYWKSVLNSFIGYFKTLFYSLPQTVQSVLGVIGSLFGALGSGIVDVIATVGQFVGEIVGYMGKAFYELFGAVFGGFFKFGAVFLEIVDYMFGSWQGFVAGMITLWHQAGFILLQVWTSVKATLLNLWEDLKFAGAAVWYYWAGEAAKLGVKLYSVFRSVCASIKAMWDNMIDYIGGKIASVYIANDAEQRIREQYQGKVIDKNLQGQMAGQRTREKRDEDEAKAKRDADAQGLIGSKRETFINQRRDQYQKARNEEEMRKHEGFVGRKLTEPELNSLIEGEKKYRVKQMEEEQKKERQVRDKALADKQRGIEDDVNRQTEGIQDWSDKGIAGATARRNANKKENNDARDADNKAVEAARQEDLKNDLAKLSKMPKASDKFKALWDKMLKALGLDGIKDFLDGLNKDAKDKKDKAKSDTADVPDLKLQGQKPLKPQRQGIEETFKNLTAMRLLAGQHADPKLAVAKSHLSEAKKQTEHLKTTSEATKQIAEKIGQPAYA